MVILYIINILVCISMAKTTKKKKKTSA